MTELDHFLKYFYIKKCITDKEKQECYKLRYSVFVEEFGYESPNQFEIEKDLFDDRADHFAVIHRETGVFSATVRFITSNNLDIPYCIGIFNNGNILDTFEVSRFSISPLFRRRLNEHISETGSCIFSEEDVRSHPLIILALLSIIVRFGKINNYYSLHAIMQERLIRLLNIYGISWDIKLTPVEYHGLRVPCFATFDTFCCNMKPTLLNFIKNLTYN